MVQTILTFGLILSPVAFHQDEKKGEKPKAEPEGTPLVLSLSAKETKFVLDTGGLSAADYKKQLEAASKAGKPFPAPTVNLKYEIKNTSDKPVRVWTTGDPVVLTATVKGNGAVNLAPLLAFTQEFRIPKAVEIAAGKSYTADLTTLTSGFRGRSHFAYWTEPGEYEIVATLKSGMSPAPKGAKEGMDGFGVVTLTSAPLKVTVEAKK